MIPTTVLLDRLIILILYYVACSADVFWAGVSWLRLVVYIRTVETAIFDVMTEEDLIGRVKIVTPDSPHFLLSFRVSAWRFREQKIKFLIKLIKNR